MPYINIKVSDENVTNEQKQTLIKGATQFVVIDEVNTDNWGIGFDQVTKLRQLA
ncbi:MAG: 4-oxalocrotonate tautomerase [Pseudohongiellaceae bacterium]|jgi:4-oxalocrotonate tautomerase